MANNPDQQCAEVLKSDNVTRQKCGTGPGAGLDNGMNALLRNWQFSSDNWFIALNSQCCYSPIFGLRSASFARYSPTEIWGKPMPGFHDLYIGLCRDAALHSHHHRLDLSYVDVNHCVES